MSEHPAPRPAAVLADLPTELWAPLLRATRRAVDDVSRTELPRGVRPFAGWHPDRLRDAHPRRAIAQALAEDAALRERVAERLEPADVARDATQLDAAGLEQRYGSALAAAGLVVTARWDDLAVLSARAAQAAASGQHAAAEEEGAGQRTEKLDGLRSALREVSAQRDVDRAQASAWEQRARRAEQRAAQLAEELAQARQRVEELSTEIVVQRRRDRGRIARLREELRQARARPVIDAHEVASVATKLEHLADVLRPAVPSGEEEPVQAASTGPSPSAVPREPPAAVAGRPCELPAGLSTASPQGVRSLLRARGLRLVLDGYNVTLDPEGRPGQALPQQRRWLSGLAGTVAARFGCAVTVMFDGRDAGPATHPSPRGVRTVFTQPAETADDRIVELVEGLDPQAPVAVVTSDVELGSRVAALGADVLASAAFLRAVDA